MTPLSGGTRILQKNSRTYGMTTSDIGADIHGHTVFCSVKWRKAIGRWVQVKMILKPDVIGASAHHRIYASLIDFIENLQEFDP